MKTTGMRPLAAALKIEFAQSNLGLQKIGSKHTLLFINEENTLRIDADSQGVLISDLEVIEQGCNSPNQLPKALSRILDLTLRPLEKSVWILPAKLPLMSMTLPIQQVRGLDADVLKQVLQYEAEGMTGQAMFAPLSIYKRIETDDEQIVEYWYSQLEQSVWDDIKKILAARKTKLRAIVHPLLLPEAMSSETKTWLRVENWSDKTIAVEKNVENKRILLIEHDRADWKLELEQWLLDKDRQTTSELLLTGRLEMLPNTDAIFDLNNEDDAALWLSKWSRILSSKQFDELLLFQAAGKINSDLLWMGVSILAALLLCALHAFWFLWQRDELDREIQQLTQIEKQLNDNNKQIADLTKEKEN